MLKITSMGFFDAKKGLRILLRLLAVITLLIASLLNATAGGCPNSIKVIASFSIPLLLTLYVLSCEIKRKNNQGTIYTALILIFVTIFFLAMLTGINDCQERQVERNGCEKTQGGGCYQTTSCPEGTIPYPPGICENKKEICCLTISAP